MAESQPQAQGGQLSQLIWRKASPGLRGGLANMAKSQPRAQGGQLIWRKAGPGLQNYFQRNQISCATSRFPNVGGPFLDSLIAQILDLYVMVSQITTIYSRRNLQKYRPYIELTILDNIIYYTQPLRAACAYMRSTRAYYLPILLILLGPKLVNS